jgi:hypothetical protein
LYSLTRNIEAIRQLFRVAHNRRAVGDTGLKRSNWPQFRPSADADRAKREGKKFFLGKPTP